VSGRGNYSVDSNKKALYKVEGLKVDFTGARSNRLMLDMRQLVEAIPDLTDSLSITKPSNHL